MMVRQKFELDGVSLNLRGSLVAELTLELLRNQTCFVEKIDAEKIVNKAKELADILLDVGPDQENKPCKP